MTKLNGAEPALMAQRCQASRTSRKRVPPTDRGKLGSKRHIIVDARSIPLVVLFSGTNRHDSMLFERCGDAQGALRPPRMRLYKLHAGTHAAGATQKA